MADPLDFETRSTVAESTGLAVQPGIANEQEILDAIDRYYGQAEKNEAGSSAGAGGDSEDLEHLRDMASEAPVIRLVNAMIAQAVEKRASDIHIEPFEKEFRIRYRIDGVLASQDPPPREMKAAIISRVKLMAKLNIAERRLAAGRTHQGEDAGPRSGSSCFDAADALWRKRRDASARPLGGRFLRSAAAWVSTSTCWSGWSTTRRCRTEFFW